MSALPVIDRGTFSRYAGLSLPRHVAYPMPTWWHDVDAAEAASLRGLSTGRIPARDLSLYLHLPFCEKMCRFCACNRTVLRKDGRSSAGRVARYLDAIIEEQRSLAGVIGVVGGERRVVRQIHWGGGTPTYLDCGQIERLHSATAELFSIHPDAEISIEVDPRVTTPEQLHTLHRLGFNRISLGVQDFDPQVQEHIGRIQPFEMVRATVLAAREAGFASINFDLIYGLPRQTVESVVRMIERAIELSPDRIAFYHYAQIPDRIANQRGLDHTSLPDSDTKLTMMLEASERFGGAGYEFIGLDHFAKPDELLAKAMRNGEINRTFQGMTTGAELDLFGFGCSAISILPRGMYLQNEHDVNAYVERVLAGADPAVRGKALTRDDGIRQAALMQLYCHAEIRPERLHRETGADFGEYFAGEREAIDRLAADGLVEWIPTGGIRLTHPLGRVLMRNVAAVFDGYLDREAPWTGLSQTFSASA
jgi:oxygen-independent coproporphyrinogen-3 oxidase